MGIMKFFRPKVTLDFIIADISNFNRDTAIKVMSRCELESQNLCIQRKIGKSVLGFIRLWNLAFYFGCASHNDKQVARIGIYALEMIEKDSFDEYSKEMAEFRDLAVKYPFRENSEFTRKALASIYRSFFGHCPNFNCEAYALRHAIDFGMCFRYAIFSTSRYRF